MIALLIWLAGAIGFLYAIDAFGFWREAIAFAVLAAAFFWIFGGGLIVSRVMRGARGNVRSRAADAAAMRQSAEHAQGERERAG